MIVLPILAVTLAVIVCWYLLSLISWAIRAANLTKNMIGPKPLPIIGNALYFVNLKDLNDGAERLIHLSKKYFHAPDRIFKFWLGPRLLIAISNPEYIKTILSSEKAQNKDLIYRHMHMISKGVIVANGETWSKLRTMLNPFMNRKTVEEKLDVFHEKSMKLVNIIDSKVDDNQEFNIKHFTAKCSIDLLLVTFYGCDINEMENNERAEPLDSVFESGMDLLFKLGIEFPTFLSVKYSAMTPTGKEVIKKGKLCTDIMTEVFKYRKSQPDHKNEKRQVYADLLIKKAERDNLSWEETAKLTTEFLLAGSHSTGLMTSWLILLIAMFPEHQEALYQEQIEILGDDPEVAPTWEQLSQMTYLTRVIKEVTRHFTTPIISRHVSEDLDLGKFILPKGSDLIITYYSLHRDPTVWSHPEEFYPDHFLPEESAKRPKHSFLPFSWGSRNCPGGLYSAIAVKSMVSALVRKFHFKTDLKYEDLTFKYSIFLDNNQGHLVKKVPRIPQPR